MQSFGVSIGVGDEEVPKPLHQDQGTLPPPPKDEILDPLRIGDFIYLRAKVSEGPPAFLHGDPAFGRLGLQEVCNKQRSPLNFEEFVFRVCPMLNYRQRHELEAATKIDVSTTSESIMHNSTQERKINLLRGRVLAEEKNNATVMESVVAGLAANNAAPIKYGDAVQLQHVATGAFMSALESAAPRDPECRTIELDEKGSRWGPIPHETHLLHS
jgi:hypothetical protein